MNLRAEYIANLLHLYFQGTITDEQAAELERWKQAASTHAEKFNDWIDAENIATRLSTLESYDMSALKQRVAENIPAWRSNTSDLPIPVTTMVQQPSRFLKTNWLRYAAAIIILLGVGAYLWNVRENKQATIADTIKHPVKTDVMPGSNKAMLTLSTGQQVQLNNATSETIKDGNLSIENNNGRLIYKKGESVAVNTMTTPKGGQYQLSLADGTKVWLNAASSITYPTAFVQNTREVSITGEVYFEVAQDPKKPFKVSTEGKPSVEVLGTHFNINAYKDEPITATTLIEGSVKTGQIILKPGQQARVTGNNKMFVESNVAIARVMAWRNGKFNFEDLNVEQVMKLIARWYDIEVVYESEPPNIQFFGTVSRDVPLSTVLKLLERSNVRFTVEGKKLIVR